jgi:hypothetical protein
MRTSHGVLFVAVTVGAAAPLAACGGGRAPRHTVASAPTATCYDGGVGDYEPPTNATLPPFAGPMVIVQPTKMEDQLRAVGLDPKHLPPFEQLTRRQLGRVMRTFSASLGIKCVGCHDPDEFHRSSPRKRAAVHMWNDFVRALETDEGAPVYCDSCHQGSVQALDRRSKDVVAQYMDDVFVGKLRRVDGKDHDCGTCHGDPPDFRFLAGWRKP